MRLAAFQWLSEQTQIHGEVLPRNVLERGFDLDGHRVPLISPQGIFKPKVLPELPLTITTTPKGPYDDKMGGNDLVQYKYRGKDPDHPDNRGLRQAMRLQTPLIYLHGFIPGKYMPIWPVFVVGDNPAMHEFSIAVDEPSTISKYTEHEPQHTYLVDEGDAGRRSYITIQARKRLHQEGFRERVLAAYREQCALCRLRHKRLLDAAHIIPDSEEGGEAVVSNGLSLCKLHHAAFDNFFLGIRPDFVIEIRGDLLKEEDGPMLLHGLQGLHGKQILIPRERELRPSENRLESKYEKFLASLDFHRP
ncbi:MAG: HNH endonuclease [Candidatus Eisenbacteria bacterium]|nr:HNH endonuclease [Candidatus Eisenbacteria bacterium]